jgi:2-hydroxychromene-2-carboxylate isomerase
LGEGEKVTASRVEFFFDLSSPWTRLAFANLWPLLERTGEQAILRPILVGGVFNAVNPAVYAAREDAGSRRLQHSWKVLTDWAALTGVTMNFPSVHHPAKSVNAMRMACALEDDQPALRRFVEPAFESYFGRQENLDDPDVLIAAANAAGLDGTAIAQASVTDANKLRLRANTDELVARGGYGSPTIFVDQTDIYFGNDQLPLVEFALKGKRP